MAPEADGTERPELVIERRGEPWARDVVDVVDGASRVVFAHTDESVYRGFMATKAVSFTQSADGIPEVLFENHLYADRTRIAERFRFHAATRGP